MTATAATTTGVDGFLAGITAGAVAADLYADDAALDAVVPEWRFSVSGAAAIAAEYGRWFAVPGHLEELRRHATATGEVVEYTLCWEEGGVPHAGHHAHILTLDAAGRIAEDLSLIHI